MFWGMNLKPNRKYSQTTAKSFHISQAALDPEGADDTVNKIFYTGEDNQKYLICTLRKNICEQVQLDLNFAEGDPICFQTVGSGNVSLSGYLVESSFFGGGPDDEESEGESMADQVAKLLNGGEIGKKKKDKKAKANKEEEEESDEDDDEDDEALNAALESDDDDDDEEIDDDEDDSDDDEEEDDEEEDDDDEEDEDDEEEIEEPKKKVAKIEKQQGKQQQQQNGAQKSKKEKKAEKQQQQQQQKGQQQQQQQPKGQQQNQQKTGEERTLTGGVKIIDVRIGNGEEAKQGKRAHVFYEGRLKSNNKVFDSLKAGAPFKFKIGNGEVIKSWDVGVAGMKVGGKRRIICPPHMAYGSRGSPPTIPPNSTLVFEVELKSVSK